MICDDVEQLDIRKLPKHLLPLPGAVTFEGVVFHTTWSATNFGGWRQWFLCPSCNKRCAIVYRAGPAGKFGCRVCLNGRYACETKGMRARRLQKVFKIRRKLGDNRDGIALPLPEKPKWMHKSTYGRLRSEAEAIQVEVLLSDLASVRGDSVTVVKECLARRASVAEPEYFTRNNCDVGKRLVGQSRS